MRPAGSAGGGVWGARVNDRGLSAAHSALFVYNCPHSLAETDRGKGAEERGLLCAHGIACVTRRIWHVPSCAADIRPDPGETLGILNTDLSGSR